jgi:hypothetical protein
VLLLVLALEHAAAVIARRTAAVVTRSFLFMGTFPD